MVGTRHFLQRFFRRLLQRIVGFMTQQTVLVGVLLLVAASVYQFVTGKFTADALKANLASVIFPYIWVVCLFVAYYVIRAAVDVYAERCKEAVQDRPRLFVPGWSPPAQRRPSIAPEAATSIVLITMLALLSYWSYSGARAPLILNPGRSEAVLQFLNADVFSGNSLSESRKQLAFGTKFIYFGRIA